MLTINISLNREGNKEQQLIRKWYRICKAKINSLIRYNVNTFKLLYQWSATESNFAFLLFQPFPREHLAMTEDKLWLEIQPGVGCVTGMWWVESKDDAENPACGLPWWLFVKESAWQCRKHRFDPWSKRVPHATKLNQCATTIEPVLQSPKLQLLKFMSQAASLVAQRLKHLPAMRETWVRSLGWEDPLEKEMATHSSILAWRIPWAEEPGGLNSPRGRKESDTTERLHFHFHWACMLQLLKLKCLEPMLYNRRSHRNAKPAHCNWSSPTHRKLEKSLCSSEDPAQPIH